MRSADLANPKNSHASPTPIVEGDRVYVHFGAEGTAALTTSGEIVWKARFPTSRSTATAGRRSLYGDLLIFSCDGSDDAFVVALDKRTGKVRWKTSRRQPWDQAYSTPLRDPRRRPRPARQRRRLPRGRLRSADRQGDLARQLRGRFLERAASRVRPRARLHRDRVSAAVAASRCAPTATGDVTKTHIAWTLKRGAPLTPSPLLVGDELFVVNDGGIASCLDATTGATHWVQRLGGAFSASPVFADGRIYFLSEEGDVDGHRAGQGVSQAGGRARSTGRSSRRWPCPSRSIFIRTMTHLYRVAPSSDCFDSSSAPLESPPCSCSRR